MTDLNNKHFQFDKYGDGPPRYSILNFRKREDDSYSWEEIGNFYRKLNALLQLTEFHSNEFILFKFLLFLKGEHDSAYKLDIDRKKMQYKRYERSYPNSTCKQHCDPTKGWVPLLKVNTSSFCTISHCLCQYMTLPIGERYCPY